MLRIRSHLRNTNSIWDHLRKSIYFSSLIMSVVSGYTLFKYFVVDTVSFNKTTSDIQKIWNAQDDSLDNYDNSYLSKFNDLIKINPDIKGWIKIDNTVIDYPVLDPPTTDPTFYLYKNYKKDYDRNGSIFVNSDICGLERDVKNIVLHGHSMRNGSMFASIIHFGDIDVYKKSPIITFDTIFERGRWKIFAVIKTNSDPAHGELFCDYFKPKFNSSQEFLKLIYDLKIRSLLNIPVEVNENDKIITLSTCSYEMKGFRTVVCARKIREEESTEVDLKNVKVNNNPKMPDGWYKARKMNIPKFKTFEETLTDSANSPTQG